MTMTQALGVGFISMAGVAFVAIYYGFKLRYKLNQMNSQDYREKVCREVLIENRKLKGFS